MPVVRTSVYRILLSVACLSLALPARAAGPAQSRVLCADDAGGALRVLVLMPPARWPAGGFEVRQGKSSLGRVGSDERARAALEPGAANALEQLPARARAQAGSGGGMIIYARLLSDWTFARAAGMGGVLPSAAHVRGTLTVMPLDAAGQAHGASLSCTVQAYVAPPTPHDLKARMREEGPALYWAPLAGRRPVPVLSYQVWRDDGKGEKALLQTTPWMPPERKADDAAYIDTLAPLEQTLTYQVALIDALGRAGPRARVQIYAADLDALTPPTGLVATATATQVDLHWKGSDNPHTSGYVVERAYLATGPYELMTPHGVPADQQAFRDQGLAGGSVYYYRVRAMGPKGDLGPASDPVAVQARSAKAPAAPDKVQATLGNTRVRLTWAVSPREVAGYVIERRAAGSPSWSRINQRLWPATRYDDPLGPQTGGTLYYRVTAVSQDNVTSAPSPVVEVKLRDTAPPLPPRIVAASGADGAVELTVQAASPAADTRRIYVLRGAGAGDPGLVIGAPLGPGATHYRDAWVEPGKTYWYHLVAYDAAGNRSADSDAVAVRVGAPAMPTPAAPKLSRETRPLPHVVVAFAAPPSGLEVLVQRSSDGAHWNHVAGPTTDASAQDLAPGTGRQMYRIRYRAADGSVGPASASVELSHD